MKRHDSLIVLLIFLLILNLSFNAADAYDLSEMLPKIWERAISKYEKAFDLLEEIDELPEEKLLGKDKKGHRGKINEIVYDALEIMDASEANELIGEIKDLKFKVVKKNKTIEDFHKKQLTAPKEGNFFTKTKQQYEEKITKIEVDIKDINEEIESKKSRLYMVLRSYGIDASNKQLESLLNSVTGDDISRMYGVFQSMEYITENIVTLMKRDERNLGAQKKYYGIYALLLKTGVAMQESFLSKVSNVYLPRLAKLHQRAYGILSDARNQLETSGDLSLNQEITLKNNIEILEIQLDVMKKYAMYLRGQYVEVEKRLLKLRSDYEVAFNTYKTICIGSDFVSMVEATKQELDIVLSLEISEIIVFDNVALEREFLQISEQLK